MGNISGTFQLGAARGYAAAANGGRPESAALLLRVEGFPAPAGYPVELRRVVRAYAAGVAAGAARAYRERAARTAEVTK